MHPVLETERLILRELTLNDLDALHRIFSDPITMRFWPAPFTLDATQQWIERNWRNYVTLGFGRWALILKDSGELIGDCGVVQAEVDGKPEYDLGYILHHPYWNRGYATESAAACLHQAINTFGLRRIVANMATDHIASRRVAEKIGMQREKTFLNPRNRNLPTYLYAYTVGVAPG